MGPEIDSNIQQKNYIIRMDSQRIHWGVQTNFTGQKLP